MKQVLDMSPLELDNLPPEDTAELNHAIEESKRLEEVSFCGAATTPKLHCDP